MICSKGFEQNGIHMKLVIRIRNIEGEIKCSEKNSATGKAGGRSKWKIPFGKMGALAPKLIGDAVLIIFHSWDSFQVIYSLVS